MKEALVQIPSWIGVREESLRRQVYADEPARMAAVIELAAENIRAAHAGGPFGAAVFDCTSGQCVSAGTNVVVAANCSLCHAETVALSRAQQRLGTYDLAKVGRFALFTSVEPCAMCLGAIIWSGVVRLVCAATGSDAEAIGFDEGPKPDHWPKQLRLRGISVKRFLLRTQAQAVLRRYREQGGAIYNPDPKPL